MPKLKSNLSPMLLLLLGNHRAHYFNLVPAQTLQSQNMAQYSFVWLQMRSHLSLFLYLVNKKKTFFSVLLTVKCTTIQTGKQSLSKMKSFVSKENKRSYNNRTLYNLTLFSDPDMLKKRPALPPPPPLPLQYIPETLSTSERVFSSWEEESHSSSGSSEIDTDEEGESNLVLSKWETAELLITHCHLLYL